MTGETFECPNCDGKGQVTITKERLDKLIENIMNHGKLRARSNAELADAISEIQNHIRNTSGTSTISQWLDEVWWRLRIADEPAEASAAKIDAMCDRIATDDSEG